jgi:hypothetical protein
MCCESAVHAVTAEDFLPSAYQARPLRGTPRRHVHGLGAAVFPKVVRHDIILIPSSQPLGSIGYIRCCRILVFAHIVDDDQSI